MANHVILFGLTAFAAAAVAQSAGTFTPTGAPTAPRFGHTMTLLTTGKVLIAGGALLTDGQPYGPRGSTASAELYDPATGTFTPIGSMTSPRSFHKATLLPDGKVFIAGGYSRQAEIYDPSTGAFSPTGASSMDFVYSSMLMADGRVLVTGCTVPCTRTAAVEIYDPATGTFDTTEATVYAAPTTTVLPDERILITGGCKAQIFDPAAAKFTPTADMLDQCGHYCFEGPPCRFYEYTNTLLPNGNVLLVGSGEDAPVDAELYDVAAGTFTSAGMAGSDYYGVPATLLPDGTVFITGAYESSSLLYRNGTFVQVANTNRVCNAYSPVLLPDGTVLLAGGFFDPGVLRCAAIYRPSVLIPAPVLLSSTGERRAQGAILHAGTARTASPNDPAVAGEYLEIYLTGLTEGSVIPPQLFVGGRMAQVVWFGSTPGFTGLNQINVRLPVGVTPGPAVPVRLSYLGRFSNEVSIAVR